MPINLIILKGLKQKTARWSIRLIDRYILKEVLSPFLAAIIFFAFVFLMFQMLRLSEFLIVNGASGSQLLKMTGYMLVSFLPLGLPIAFLVAVLTAFGRFSSDSEMVAMKVSGLSLLRLSLPVHFLALGVALLSLMLNMSWTPSAELALRRLIVKMGNTKFSTSIQEGTFTSGFMNLLLFTEHANNRAGKMENVFIYDERDAKNPLTIISKYGELIQIQQNDEDTNGLILQLSQGSIHQSAASESRYNLSRFGIYQIYLNMPEASSDVGTKPKMNSFRELMAKRNQAPLHSGERLSLDTEVWRRMTVAFVPFCFVLLGMGLGTVRTRATRFGAILISFLAMAGYWQILVSAIWLGSSGLVLPALAMQIPNLIVGFIGVLSFKRANW